MSENNNFYEENKETNETENDRETLISKTNDDDKEIDAFDIDLAETCWCPKCDCLNWHKNKKCSFSLTQAALTATILGTGFGLLIQKYIPNISKYVLTLLEFPGLLWIQSLQLLVIPLLSLMMLILPSRVDKIGRIAKTGLPFFILTSVLAGIQGIFWVNIIKPGTHGGQIFDDGITVDDTPYNGNYIDNNGTYFNDSNYYNTTKNMDDMDSDNVEVSELDAVLNIFLGAVPDNIINSMIELNVTGVICFFFLYGALLRQINKKQSKIIVTAANVLLQCTMVAISWAVWFTPVAIFSIVLVKIIGTNDFFGLLKALGMYLVTSIVGQCGHIFLILPILFLLITRCKENPWKHFCKISQATLVAFGTASSAATLGVSREVAQHAGSAKNIVNFIVPLGAAINMDGMSQQFPINVIFIAQLFGVTLSIGKQITVVILSIIISVGAAPVPNAGPVYLIMVLKAADLEDFIEVGVATLLILDWLIDRIGTSVNVTSDQYIVRMVDAIERRRDVTKGDDDEEE